MRKTLAGLVAGAVLTGCGQQSEIREVCPPDHLRSADHKNMPYVILRQENNSARRLQDAGESIDGSSNFSGSEYSFTVGRENSEQTEVGTLYKRNESGMTISSTPYFRQANNGCWRTEE